MKKVLSILLSVLVIVGGGGYLLATQADAATPVDPLFPVDTFFENLQRLVTLSDVSKVELEQEILEERQLEVETVLGTTEATEEDIDECLNLMNQQREKVLAKLGEVQEKQEQKGNTQAVESLQKVQEQYQEHLVKQLETANNAQAKFAGVGQEAKEEIQQNMEQEDNSLQNAGEDTQIQQQNQEQNTDNGQGDSDSGNSGNTGGPGNGNN